MRRRESGNPPQQGSSSLKSLQVNHLTARQDSSSDLGTSLAQLERVTTATKASDTESQGVRGLRRAPQTVALPDFVERLEMKNLLKRLMSEDRGQDVIEYALLAAGISVVAIPTVPAVGTAVGNSWTFISGRVATIPGA